MTSKRSRQPSVRCQTANEDKTATASSDTKVQPECVDVVTVNSAGRIRLFQRRSGSYVMRNSLLKKRTKSGDRGISASLSSWKSDTALASAASKCSHRQQSVPGMYDSALESLIAARYSPTETNMSAVESGETDSEEEYNENEYKDDAANEADEDDAANNADEDDSANNADEDDAANNADEDDAENEADEDDAAKKADEDMLNKNADEDDDANEADEDDTPKKADEDILNKNSYEDDTANDADEDTLNKNAKSSTSPDTNQATASDLEQLPESLKTSEKAGEEMAARAVFGDGQPVADGHPIFNNLYGGSQQKTLFPNDPEQPRSQMANVIEKAILDFCSSRTVETMRRVFADIPSELEAQLHSSGGSRSGEKTFLVPHPVTGELVKEGIIIGKLDVFALRFHKEFRLEMKDSLVEGFLNDSAIFRSICHRTKCQLEITRRLLNKKLCAGGRWVKFLIVRIVGPSFRAISTCDKMLQMAVPAYKYRMDYSRAARCRVFFREDIPDNTSLYYNMQRTGGTSSRFGSLRLDTPYRVAPSRTSGNCPWKMGALKVGKLAFSGSGSNKCMKQVYPGYGYNETTAVASESQGVDAIRRVAKMHGEYLAKEQMRVLECRLMTIPVNR